MKPKTKILIAIGSIALVGSGVGVFFYLRNQKKQGARTETELTTKPTRTK